MLQIVRSDSQCINAILTSIAHFNKHVQWILIWGERFHSLCIGTATITCSVKDGIILRWCVNQVVHSHVQVVFEMLQHSLRSLLIKAHLHQTLNHNRVRLSFLSSAFMSCLSFRISYPGEDGSVWLLLLVDITKDVIRATIVWITIRGMCTTASTTVMSST